MNDTVSFSLKLDVTGKSETKIYVEIEWIENYSDDVPVCIAEIMRWIASPDDTESFPWRTIGMTEHYFYGSDVVSFVVSDYRRDMPIVSYFPERLNGDSE